MIEVTPFIDGAQLLIVTKTGNLCSGFNLKRLYFIISTAICVTADSISDSDSDGKTKRVSTQVMVHRILHK